jgi:hypothetical protein
MQPTPIGKGCASLTAVWLRCANPDNVSTLCDFTERSRSIAQHLSDGQSCDGHRYLQALWTQLRD